MPHITFINAQRQQNKMYDEQLLPKGKVALLNKYDFPVVNIEHDSLPSIPNCQSYMSFTLNLQNSGIQTLNPSQAQILLKSFPEGRKRVGEAMRSTVG